MKRFVILLALLSLCVSAAMAQTPQGEQVLQLLQQLRQREGAGTPNADQLREVERAVRQLQQSQPGNLTFGLTAQRVGVGGRGAGRQGPGLARLQWVPGHCGAPESGSRPPCGGRDLVAK